MNLAATLRASGIFSPKRASPASARKHFGRKILDHIRLQWAYKRILDGEFMQTRRGIHRQIDFTNTLLALGKPKHWARALASGHITNEPEQACLALAIKGQHASDAARYVLDRIALQNSYAMQVLRETAALSKKEATQ